MVAAAYRGRFAPSPTGPLHVGSLVAALASYLDARAHDGRWLLRIEDLDAPRVQKGATEAIIATLQCYGFAWDEVIVCQSERGQYYRSAFDALRVQGRCYPCACSRKEIADSALDPDRRHVYPGTCRKGLAQGRLARAWRIGVGEHKLIEFTDRCCGTYTQQLASEVGDFVIARTDGTWTYQLAVVVDDFLQGITHVVRGADLLDSTPRQIYLQTCLGYPTPCYAHVPVVVNALGEKLSKQTGANALDRNKPLETLQKAMVFLGFSPQKSATLDSFWQWAISVWAERYLS